MNRKMPERVRPGRRRRQPPPRFPLGKFIGVVVLMIIGGLFVYRLSETGGQPAQRACLGALSISFVAACSGLYPVYKVWGRDLMWTLLGVFLSSVIRLLIGCIGVVIITVFTDLQRTLFVAFLGLFYSVFLAFDTWLSLWVLQHAKAKETDDQETVVHGNIWDIVGRHRKPA